MGGNGKTCVELARSPLGKAVLLCLSCGPSALVLLLKCTDPKQKSSPKIIRTQFLVGSCRWFPQSLGIGAMAVPISVPHVAVFAFTEGKICLPAAARPTLRPFCAPSSESQDPSWPMSTPSLGLGRYWTNGSRVDGNIRCRSGWERRRLYLDSCQSMDTYAATSYCCL